MLRIDPQGLCAKKLRDSAIDLLQEFVSLLCDKYGFINPLKLGNYVHGLVENDILEMWDAINPLSWLERMSGTREELQRLIDQAESEGYDKLERLLDANGWIDEVELIYPDGNIRTFDRLHIINGRYYSNGREVDMPW